MKTIPISVLIPTRNEARNLAPVLESISGWADEVVIVDSGSTDGTVEMAEARGAKVLQFRYEGGWPKKRQWALDTFAFRNDWIFLLDADEIVTPELRDEIERAIRDEGIAGYYIRLESVFLGRRMRHAGSSLWKLNLFRRGKGAYERRFDRHTREMSDVEIHEHVRVDGETRKLKRAIEHRNVNSLHRYIAKHNEYSTWEAELVYNMKLGIRSADEIPPKLFGTQAQRRRWIKAKLYSVPGFSLGVFLYSYLFRLGVLDGVPGLIWSGFQAVQGFHTKAKVREMMLERRREP